jgi:hypothetical protein
MGGPPLRGHPSHLGSEEFLLVISTKDFSPRGETCFKSRVAAALAATSDHGRSGSDDFFQKIPSAGALGLAYSLDRLRCYWAFFAAL